MGIFEDVVITARSAVNLVGKKAEQIVDVSKLRLTAADLNNEIAERYEALGKMVYRARKTGEGSDALVDGCVEVLDRLYEQLDEINDQLATAHNRIKCKACGYENLQDAVFCSKCGVKLTASVEKEGDKQEDGACSCGCAESECAQEENAQEAEQQPSEDDEKKAE
ncbi:MAG TPA: zinc ribbon domain-containing protein [Candidatus Gallacutalibacter stercoravium]|nr:zinc ribbon domain-containing protein [Candidatus Gallacutalibacter stercoravium]